MIRDYVLDSDSKIGPYWIFQLKWGFVALRTFDLDSKFWVWCRWPTCHSLYLVLLQGYWVRCMSFVLENGYERYTAITAKTSTTSSFPNSKFVAFRTSWVWVVVSGRPAFGRNCGRRLMGIIWDRGLLDMLNFNSEWFQEILLGASTCASTFFLKLGSLPLSLLDPAAFALHEKGIWPDTILFAQQQWKGRQGKSPIETKTVFVALRKIMALSREHICAGISPSLSLQESPPNRRLKIELWHFDSFDTSEDLSLTKSPVSCQN